MPLDISPSPAPRLRSEAKIADLRLPSRIWAVGSIYGRFGALCSLHEALSTKVRPADRIIYLGNYLGAYSQWSGEGRAVIGEIITFRNAFIATPDFLVEDIAFLRGRLEDLALELMRLPFQKNPKLWVAQALEQGLEGYLSAYGITVPDVLSMADAGLPAAHRFAHHWKKVIDIAKGHSAFYGHLSHAARTAESHPLGFIPEGLDPKLPLALQFEALRRDAGHMSALTRYGDYVRIVRGAGYPSAIDNSSFVLTLDGGNRLDGMIHAACLDPQGRIIEHLTF